MMRRFQTLLVVVPLIVLHGGSMAAAPCTPLHLAGQEYCLDLTPADPDYSLREAASLMPAFPAALAVAGGRGDGRDEDGSDESRLLAVEEWAWAAAMLFNRAFDALLVAEAARMPQEDENDRLERLHLVFMAGAGATIDAAVQQLFDRKEILARVATGLRRHLGLAEPAIGLSRVRAPLPFNQAVAETGLDAMQVMTLIRRLRAVCRTHAGSLLDDVVHFPPDADRSSLRRAFFSGPSCTLVLGGHFPEVAAVGQVLHLAGGAIRIGRVCTSPLPSCAATEKVIAFAVSDSVPDMKPRATSWQTGWVIERKL